MGSFRGAVRRKLSITWDDETTEEQLSDIIAGVGESLALLLGCSAKDVEEDPRLLQLALNACMYEWNNVSDQFKANYAGDIIEKRRLFECQ